MNIEHVDNVFYKSNLQQLLAQIYIDNKNEASKNDDINILNLLAFPVTSKSLFRDDVWDYTADVEIAKTMRGSRLIIDFSAYNNIPKSIVAELKIAIVYIRIIPKRSQNRRVKSGQTLSMQSITPMVKSW